MTYALVGSVGAISVGANNTDVTAAWGTGETRAAGNLLICLVSSVNGGTQPTVPSGWTSARSASATNVGGAALYRVAAGSDAAPTIVAATGMKWNVQLSEFSGGATVSPLDQTGLASGTTAGSITATAPSPDVASGELVVVVSAAHYSATTAMANSNAINDATTHDLCRNGTNVEQYGFAWGITTSNAGATANTFAYTTTGAQHAITVVATFLVAAPTPGAPLIVRQAVSRASVI